MNLNLLSSIVRAAETGNYCHGNGADFFIVGTRKRVWHIHLPSETVQVLDEEETARYLSHTPARRDVDVARRLRAHAGFYGALV